MTRCALALLLAACGTTTTTTAPAPSTPPTTIAHAMLRPPAIDLDGDGLAEIVVQSLGSGGAGVYLGGPSPRLAPFVLGGPDVAGAFGRDVMGVGDLDHNGWGDVAIADELYQRVLVYLVDASGIGTPSVLTIPADGAPIPNVAVAAAGDVNEDGFADLVVGSTGAIYLYSGSAAGIGTTPTRIAGPSTYGASVAGGRDVNGDGHADVVVGTSLDHAIFVHYGNGRALGAASRLDGGGQQMGDDIAMADVNHDGCADVITSGYGGNGGWIFYGSRAGLGPTPTSLGASASAGWSQYVSSAGDVDHDGFEDVVVGGYARDGAFLYRGSSTGLVPEPQRLPPIHPDVPWMYRVRGVGDVDGDGFDDVVVDNTMLPRFLYRGRASGLTPGPIQLDARPDPSAPPVPPPPPTVTFPPVETTCTVDADCVRVSKRDDTCCPLCAQYVAANHAWASVADALCAARPGACAISCAEGPPPTVHCAAGHCALR